MKTWQAAQGALCLCFVFVSGLSAAEAPPVTVSDLAVKGAIEGENIAFTLTFQADVRTADSRLVLVEGDVACLRSELPKRVELRREGRQYLLVFHGTGRQSVTFEFAALAVKDGNWRSARFVIPESNVRRLTLACDRNDLEVEFPGALGVERHPSADGRTEVRAYLGAVKDFAVRWKPEVKALAGELAVTCDANTIAGASVGALRIDSLFTYRVVQGALQTLTLGVPADLNVTQVRGADIREWRLEKGADGRGRLLVQLSRAKESGYVLGVEGERVLPAFPCRFVLPVLTPEGVIRTSGFLMIGTDRAVKLLVNKASGVTQVDQAAFPTVKLDDQAPRPAPTRSVFAYQYAGMPYQLELAADDIRTTLYSEDSLELALTDNDLTLQAVFELDVRDAPARELVVESDPTWVVARVSGANVADYDVRDQGTTRLIHVYFKEAALGRATVEMRLEKSLADRQTTFAAPSLAVRDARSERGYLTLSGEQGVRFHVERNAGLREVHTGSLPKRVADVRQAFRFKNAGWTLGVTLDKTQPSIHAESFHLATLGEASVFGSCSITYHVSGAPMRALRLAIPAACQNVEFTGRDVRGWERQGAEWQVSFQEKIVGDYTLLVTYDQPFSYEGGELRVGGIATVGSESEVGYLVLAGAVGRRVEPDAASDPALLEVEAREIPRAYALLINDPVLRAYKYVGRPGDAVLRVRRYDTHPLLGQVADHTALTTRVSREGEAVSTASYFVKNSSQQYLEVTLPEHARLWSARVDDEPVQVLDLPDRPGGLLVPVRRHRDPNRSSRVEITYAETLKPIRFVRALTLRAPQAAAQSVFSRWTVTAPDGFIVGRARGNLPPAEALETVGLLGVGRAVVRLVSFVGRQAAGWLVWAGLAALLVCLYAYGRGQGRFGRKAATALGVPLLIAAALVWRASPSLIGVWERLPLPFRAPPAAASFVRPVSLADSEPLLQLQIVPAWMGASGSLAWLAVSVVAGLACVARGGKKASAAWRASEVETDDRLPVRARNAGLTWRALGLTLMVWGLSSLAITAGWVSMGLVVGLPLAVAFGAARWAYGAGRRHPYTPPPVSTPPEEPPPLTYADISAPVGGTAGTAAPGLLVGLLAAVLAVGAASAADTNRPSQTAQAQSPPASVEAPLKSEISNLRSQISNLSTAPLVRVVDLQIQGAGLGKEEEKIARVTATIEFEAEASLSWPILPKPHVLTAFDLNSRHLGLAHEADGYRLTAQRAGSYRIVLHYLTPLVEREGLWTLAAWLPPALRNQTRLLLPETGLDVQSGDAVQLKIKERERETEVTAVFGTAAAPVLSWRPRERKTKLEKAVFACEVNTLAVFEAGVVNLGHAVRYQIAQGELQALILSIPTGMSVTAVSAPGLSTWRFDPDTRRLEALLDKPVSGEIEMRVTTQAPREQLPYDVSFAVPCVEAAARQRGTVALAAADTVQIRVDATNGLSAMNVSDVPVTGGSAAAKVGAPTALKRAFRYHQLPVAVGVRAEPVLPEIRVTEDARLDISDERIVLSARLDLAVARSGIFSARIALPPDYDVESLTGQDVSHWDEIKDGGHGVWVHFDKQILGNRQIQLVVSRTEKGVGESIVVPRVAVEGAVRQSGVLAVSGERGVRFMTTQREGVSEINPSEVGIAQAGTLAFKILRPDWSVTLKTEVLAPVVRAEVLQRVTLAEGLLQARCMLDYKIDNAGVKTFLLRAPQPGTALSVVGRNVAAVRELDKTNGLWQVELHNKVEATYALEVGYQMQYDPRSPTATLLPLRAEGTEAQKGWLVVRAGARLTVTPQSVPEGLKAEDARGIPAPFQADDLSDAILCYRTTRPDYALTLSVVRHDTAEVLPAAVERLRLESVLSDDAQQVTRARIEMRVGALRFLKTTLPEDSRIWSVFVNGKSVTPLREETAFLIPLDAVGEGETTAVELIYGGRVRSGLLAGRRLVGPTFDLPLRDIAWAVYAPSSHRYGWFGGTLTHRAPEGPMPVARFDDRSYLADAAAQNEQDRRKAESVLKQGEQYAREGRQQEAKKAFETALHYSQGQADFNEDVRIQYRNLAKQQAVVGLVNRRDALRAAQNVQVQDDQQLRQIRGFQDGHWTADYGRQVAQSLSAKDGEHLNRVAEKILDQQAAAAGTAYPLRPTIPLQGCRLDFARDLQIEPGAVLRVSFRAFGGGLGRGLGVGAMALGLWLAFRLLFGIVSRPRVV